MAGSKADYSELKVLEHMVGKTSFTMPTTYIALFTTACTDAANGTEVSGGSYARVATSGKWGTAAAGQIQNNAEIAFAEATASWGTVVSFAIMDNSSGGNTLYWGDLTTSKSIASGDTAKFAASAITITED